MAMSRKKEVKLKKMLIVIWALFIIVLGLFGFFAYQKREVIEDDLIVTTRFSYQTNANPDVNALVITYLSAYASCDQETLRSCVTDPTKFNDMSTIQSQSMIINSYSNINCYTVKGLSDEAVICYAVANLSIYNVEVKPIDMLGPYYIVMKDGQYKIENGELSDNVKKYMAKVNRDDDIQELYQMVKEDQEEKMEEDEAFKNFINNLGN